MGSGRADCARIFEQAGLRHGDGVASPFGEIDPSCGMVRRVFVEVKMRRSEAFGGVHQAITPHKLARLRKAIALYIQTHPECNGRIAVLTAFLVQVAGNCASYRVAAQHRFG